MTEFSSLQRQARIEKAKEDIVDLVVIGGGITGAGIALDAASRGLSVTLVEMQDFAEGTSSRSTKLVHGGLRYLKQLEVAEVAELGREREVVYENAPHVTTPVRMLLPFHVGGTFGKYSTALGLQVYDTLAGVKKSERRFMLTKDETLAREPLVKEQDLLGGGVYVEYRTDDARLTIEVIKAAVARGANVFNYMKAVNIDSNPRYMSVEVEDQLTNEKHELRALKVVNAAGPWVDEVRKIDVNDSVKGKHLILSKGVHVVFDQSKFPLKQAIYFDTPDGRMLFAIPRQGKAYIGTTDTFYEGDPRDMTINQEDIDYVMKCIHYMFPEVAITEQDIESGWAGVRPLVHEEGKSPSEISRKDEIWQSEGGLITIAGGKLTGYRKMAQKIVNLVVKQLKDYPNKEFKKCTTKHIPLSGADLGGSKHLPQYIERSVTKGVEAGLTAKQARHLAELYGTNFDIVLSYVAKNDTDLPNDVYAQLHYGIDFEAVAKPVDFFIRRTGALFFNIAFVQKYHDAVISEMAKTLNWTDDQTKTYTAQLDAEINNVTKHLA